MFSNILTNTLYLNTPYLANALTFVKIIICTHNYNHQLFGCQQFYKNFFQKFKFIFTLLS
jgi:hypothetical protein